MLTKYFLDSIDIRIHSDPGDVKLDSSIVASIAVEISVLAVFSFRVATATGFSKGHFDIQLSS